LAPGEETVQQAKKEGGNFRAEMKNDVSGTLIDETEVLSVLFRQVTIKQWWYSSRYQLFGVKRDEMKQIVTKY
jgi:hypothetical protein